ncbi:MAG TPA: polysaccharide deacetylase family protein [Candidatus Avoscillospira avicola]|uniref:Polysaccharide deacetylase family protein n=1 Tax=Candidatus Avoscillospira avicola TaxID=2840706 RepID=A0A9D1AQW7_9FIRM|nr:polysaccharide deacetylase family protein [Candidatus Avoscillospira avicola]
MDQERNRRPGGVGKALLGALLVLVLAAELGAAGLLVWYLRLPKETEAITVPVTPLQPTEETAPEPAPTPDPEPDPAQQELLQARQALLERAYSLAQGYYYTEALALLDQADSLRNPQTEALRQEIAQKQAELVPYEGDQFYHIFFHSLIVDTDRAFDGDYDSAGYDLYMTTVSEFKAMLPKLQAAGFILYDITDLVEFRDGKAVRREILLPPGKKPLVISVDDVNYYKYMEGDGFAERLDVDETGRVVTVVDGQPTYDGDVMPILDQYVAEHPEFSWQGAKGVVAITGYEGAFGYRITDLEDYDAETQAWMLQKTQDVAEALRGSGWQIACHSYTHNQYWSDRTITDQQEQYDIGRWKRDIAPYVGETNIFISPFGVSFADDDPRLLYLKEQGFTIYCPVEANMTTRWENGMLFQGRLNLDGLVMKDYPERVKRFFFDPADLLDPARPG